MKNPLRYQISEYDCGPTSLLNAVSYLFEREEIAPEIIRNIMLYSLDNYNNEGIQGKSGTSAAAMMFLTNWLNNVGRIGRLNVSGRHITEDSVFVGPESLIDDALRRGGAAVVLCYFDELHYILLTGVDGDSYYAFDPYYCSEPFDFAPDIQMITDHPKEYNRIIPSGYLNSEGTGIYALGPVEQREAVILFNGGTKMTADKTIEYFI